MVWAGGLRYWIWNSGKHSQKTAWIQINVLKNKIPHYRTIGDAFTSNGLVLIASEKR